MADSSSNAMQDVSLESFITMVRQDPDLKAEIKAALNQDDVIAIAASKGYEFDSSTILRRWSKHTDFTQDTWMGWFDE